MDKDKLTQALKEDQGISAAILFGSHASGHANSSSDIDVGVFYRSSVPTSIELLQFKQKLSDQMGLDVDLVVLNQASPIISMQVIKNGVPLFIRRFLKLFNLF